MTTHNPGELDSSGGVLVLSPPRAGSSCVTACISFQGFSIGKTPTTVKDSYNEKGYFENEKILSFNTQRLYEVTGGDDIHRSDDLSDKENSALCGFPHQYKRELSDILKSEFSKPSFIPTISGPLPSVPFVIKDPRILLMRSLYFPLLPDVKVICLSRDRTSCVSSMMRMSAATGGSRTAAQYGGAWDNYVELLNGIGGVFPFIRVRFEEFIVKPEKALEKICSFLEVPFTTEGCRASLEFIDRKLIRYGND
jgi:hypothetical protein